MMIMKIVLRLYVVTKLCIYYLHASVEIYTRLTDSDEKSEKYEIMKETLVIY